MRKLIYSRMRMDFDSRKFVQFLFLRPFLNPPPKKNKKKQKKTQKKTKNNQPTNKQTIKQKTPKTSFYAHP